MEETKDLTEYTVEYIVVKMISGKPQELQEVDFLKFCTFWTIIIILGTTIIISIGYLGVMWIIRNAA